MCKKLLRGRKRTSNFEIKFEFPIFKYSKDNLWKLMWGNIPYLDPTLFPPLSFSLYLSISIFQSIYLSFYQYISTYMYIYLSKYIYYLSIYPYLQIKDLFQYLGLELIKIQGGTCVCFRFSFLQI